ncbi:MAG: T9SS type A sorting domain-containing protein [Bacteroidia bacterium]|nr:T9SS type A sorting domain-containing protein [Bacteroidia bacterium]
MKKYKFFLLTSGWLFLVRCVWGQGNPCPDSVGIATNPISGQAFNNESNQPVNTFNWMNPTLTPSTMYGTYLNQPPLSSPYFGNNYLDLIYLSKGTDSDFYPEEGWELVHWGFGELVDGTDEYTATGKTRQLPSLVLYNRYSGMLHVFGASDFTESNVIQIELRFTLDGSDSGERPNYKPSGLFAYATPVAQPLDQETTVSRVTSRSRNPNLTLAIFHAAFPVAYDPCVCHNLGAFQILYRRIKNMDVSLIGRFAGTSYSPAEYYAGGSSPASFEEFLNPVVRNGDNVVAGVQVYKDATKMYDDLITEMNQKGKFDIVAALDVLKARAELGAEVFSIAKIPGTEIGASYSLKVSAKAINYAQSLIKFKKSQDPAQPSFSLPAIIREESTMSGTITDSLSEKFVSEVAIPGSKDTWTLPESSFDKPYYPLYNEELGIFALLETPVVQRHVDVTSVPGTNPCYAYGIPSSTETELTTTQTSSYRLASPLKYAVNPADRLDLANSDISVALMIRSRFADVNLIGGGFSNTTTTLGNLEEGPDAFVYYSPFLPIECLENLSVYLSRVSTGCFGANPNFEEDSLFLVFANTYLTSKPGKNGNPLISQQILTFPVIIEEVLTALPVSPILPFSTTVTGVLTGDIKAWREVTVTGTVSSTLPVSIFAGTNLIISPTALLNPNISLLTGVSPIACASVNLPQTAAQRDAFCTSSQYKANQLSRLGWEYLENKPPRLNEEKEPDDIPLTAYPNPFTHEFTLSFSLSEVGLTSARLLDLTGREIARFWEHRESKAGLHAETVNLSNLAAGIYLVVLETAQGRQTVRIVKE